MNQFKTVATEFAEPSYLAYSEFLAGSDLQTANATFSIGDARGVSFDLADNVDGRVVLSYDADIAQPQVVVESVWQGEDDADDTVAVQQAVEMGLGNRASSLMIKVGALSPEDTDSAHIFRSWTCRYSIRCT